MGCAGSWAAVAAADNRTLHVVAADGHRLRLLRVDGPIDADRPVVDGDLTVVAGDPLEEELADRLLTRVAWQGDRVVELVVTARVVPDLPAVWWHEVPEPDAVPPATNLLAFTGRDVAAFRVLDGSEYAASGARSDDQVAAVRWYVGTGEVDQVYVQPDWRRRDVGTAVLRAAGALVRVRGWPALWGDGQRTALGERFRNAATWRDRTADLTVLLPPMTPYDERAEGGS